MGSMQSRPGRPLLADSARPWAGAVLVCCAVIVAALGMVFGHQAKADWLDQAVDAPVISWLSSRQGLAIWFAAPGSLAPAAALSAAIAIACLLVGRLNGALLAAAAVPIATGLNDGLLKHLVHRTYLGALSYPSGHIATMSALAATVAVLLLAPPQTVRTGPLRMLLAAAACVVGGIVAIGVIGLRWHYFTDTVAGAAVGLGVVCGLALLLDLQAVRQLLVRLYGQPQTAQDRRTEPNSRV